MKKEYKTEKPKVDETRIRISVENYILIPMLIRLKESTCTLAAEQCIITITLNTKLFKTRNNGQ